MRRTVIWSTDPFADVDGFLSDMEAAAGLGVDEVAVVSLGDPVAFADAVGEQLVGRLAEL